MNITLCILYIIVSISQIFSAFFLVAKGSNHKKTYMFLGCQLSSILWCLSQVLIFLSNNTLQLQISYTAGNLGITFIGAFWIGFAIHYVGKKHNKITGIMFLISGLHYIMVTTNSIHHLYYKEFQVGKITYGPLFYTNVIYTYVCVFIGILIIQLNKKQGKNYIFQKRILMASAVFPLILNFLRQMKIVHTQFDITPLGFCLSYLLIMIATFRYNFLDVNQLAFQQVMKDLQEGILIFRYSGELSFQNKMIQKIFPEKIIENIGDFEQLIEEKNRQELKETGETLLIKENIYYHLQKNLHYEKEQQVAAISFVMKDVSKYYELVEQTKKVSVLEQSLAVEQERNKLVQQVHDTTGHTLTVIRSLIKLAMANLEPSKEEAKDYMNQAEELVKTGIKELREYILDVKKEEKYSLITQRVMQLADTIKEIHIEVTVIGEDDKKYSFLTETVFLCVKESITNCLRYGKASEMEIILKFCETHIEVFIFDNGVGCEKIEYGNGLTGILHRVKEKGGTLKINTAKGEGFQTVINLPLDD